MYRASARKIFVTIIVVTLGVSVLSIRKLLEIKKPFTGHLNLIEEEDAVDNLIVKLGYGGMIHNYNKYILRKDKAYFDEAIKNYREIKESLNFLRSDEWISSRTNLSQIEAAVDYYYQNLFKAKRLFAEGKSTNEVDEATKVNDVIAVPALYKVSQKLHELQLKNINDALLNKRKNGGELGLLLVLLIIFLFLAIFYEYKSLLKLHNRASEFMRNLFNEVKSPIISFNSDFSIRYVNQAGEKFWRINFPNQSLEGKSWFNLLLGDRLDNDFSLEKQAINKPHSFIKRFEGEEEKFTEQIYEISLNTLQEEVVNQERHGIIVLTDRSKQVDDNMKSELHHRVKNNLSLLIGLIEMMKRDTQNDSEVREKLDMLISKVYSISTMYDNEQEVSTCEKINVYKYFNKLIEQHRHFNLYMPLTSKLEISNDLYISSTIAVPLGLIFSEFLINSIKHSKVEKELIIEASVYYVNNGLSATFKDNGKSSGEEKKSKNGLGRKIIDILALQIESQVEINHDDGCTLELRPLQGQKDEK